MISFPAGRLAGRFFRRFYRKEDRAMYGKIFHLTWPAFFELFLSSLFGAVDLAMVGSLSPAAIAGVGITNQPFFLLIAMFAAVNVGTTTLVSWSYGSGDLRKASYVLKQAVIINMAAGTVISAAGAACSGLVMRVMSTDPDIIRYGTIYLRIICYGLMFQAVTMAISATLRGCGLTRLPMVYNLIANGANVIMNYLLIYGRFGFPAMGVRGAAIGTSISKAIALSIALWFVLFSKRSPVKIYLNTSWLLNRKVVADMLAIGLPAAGEQFVIQTGLLVFSRIVETLGVNAYAAHHVAASINSLAFSVSQAFSVSATALVGQSVGADEYDRAARYTILTRRAARLIAGGVAASFIFLGGRIALLYTKEADVLALCMPLFWFIAAAQFIQSSQMSTAGALRGAGDTMYPLYASIAGIWVFRIILASIFVFVFKWGLVGAWLSFFLDQCMRSFVVKRRFNSGRWRQMKAIKSERSRKREMKRFGA